MTERTKKARVLVFVLLTVLTLCTTSVIAQNEKPLSAETWALVIGIQRYSSFPQYYRDYATEDAQAMYEFLIASRGLKMDHVKLLLNEDATLSAVRAGLDWLSQQAQPDDRVIFYFSGRSYRVRDRDGDEADGCDESLAVYDTDLDFIALTGVRDDELALFLDRIESKHQLIVLDICLDRGTERALPSGRQGPHPGSETIWYDYGSERKLSVISDASVWVRPFATADLGHGALVYLLLNGLSGNADENYDRCITYREIRDYLLRESLAYAGGGIRDKLQIIGDPALLDECLIRLFSVPDEGEDCH